MKRYWRRSRTWKVEIRRLIVRSQQWTTNYQLLTIVLLIVCSCTQNRKFTQKGPYSCPMHPAVARDEPGTCPVCGMDLVLKEKGAEEGKIAEELNYLLKPVNAAVISSIKTILPTLKSMEIKMKANGIITYDTRRVTTISSRFNGRIEKLFIKYNFQPIHKGQKILEIYSPDLLTAQRDLLYLLKSDKENSELIDRAKEKLKLVGVLDEQINLLISSGKESNSFSVYSSEEGYLTNSTEVLEDQTELELREGMYVTAGQALFKVADTKNVLAEFDLFSKDIASIKVNDPVKIKIEEAAGALDAKINFMQLFYKEGQRFTKVRVYLSNSHGNYRIGQLVSASFDKSSPESLWIPLSAQFDLGTRKIVFVKQQGMFQPKEISTERQSDRWIEVSRGIKINDSLAYNAQFLVDRESFIKIKK